MSGRQLPPLRRCSLDDGDDLVAYIEDLASRRQFTEEIHSLGYALFTYYVAGFVRGDELLLNMLDRLLCGEEPVPVETLNNLLRNTILPTLDQTSEGLRLRTTLGGRVLTENEWKHARVVARLLIREAAEAQGGDASAN